MGRKRRNKNKYKRYNDYTTYYNIDSGFKVKYGCEAEYLLLLNFHGMLPANKKTEEAIKEAKRIMGAKWIY